MKKFITLFSVLVLIALISISPSVSLSDTQPRERWTSGPWEAQDLISWGYNSLVVDFGANGLWNYNGSWIQLSRWNSEDIVIWKENNLVVNFGAKGLWNFDGNSWKKIAGTHSLEKPLIKKN